MKPDIDWWTIAYISGAGVIIWWGFRRLIKRFDSLIEAVKKMDKTMVLSNYRIKSLEDNQRIHNRRINKLTDRVTKLELNKK